MTVTELIEQLKSFNGDTIVSVSGYEDGYTDKFGIIEKSLMLDVHEEWYYGEHDDTDYGRYDLDDVDSPIKTGRRVVIYR